MSPIGRVFIVLNLALAGGFVVVSGTHLQKQHTYKEKLEKEQADRKKDVDLLTQQVKTLEGERNQFENGKTKAETDVANLTNSNQQLVDENKRLSEQNASFDSTLKGLLTAQQSATSESKAAFEKANAAYQMAVADQKAKDEAIRVKDATVAENRGLNNKIAELTEAVSKRDGDIAALTADKSQLTLLVKVAETNGFIRAMAAPNLVGMVTMASDRLCTVQVTDNPGNVNVKEAIELGKWSFAIYDASGYKGEAVAEKFEESTNSVLCKVFPVKGEIKSGDKAATKTP
ncbi:MAG: hypothetical protein JNK15_08280 [Planctomycetes bacterium]|nr:hypothetical protein [Planctomycetota bacterium]